ncbi:hypothetical protein C8J56DRAFT_896747 [Mycena floridula]|nr:hypothetical protein C8J56DRAFT_896747 [Mycena floridula]
MGVSLPEHEALCAASAKFITDEKFGAPQLENVMETVFRPYAGQQGNPEAETWKRYDDVLNIQVPKIFRLRRTGPSADRYVPYQSIPTIPDAFGIHTFETAQISSIPSTNI